MSVIYGEVPVLHFLFFSLVHVYDSAEMKCLIWMYVIIRI